jgi:hypothetical protein
MCAFLRCRGNLTRSFSIAPASRSRLRTGGGGRTLTEEDVCAAVALLSAGPVTVVAELERGADEVVSVRIG